MATDSVLNPPWDPIPVDLSVGRDELYAIYEGEFFAMLDDNIYFLSTAQGRHRDARYEHWVRVNKMEQIAYFLGDDEAKQLHMACSERFWEKKNDPELRAAYESGEWGAYHAKLYPPDEGDKANARHLEAEDHLAACRDARTDEDDLSF